LDIHNPEPVFGNKKTILDGFITEEGLVQQKVQEETQYATANFNISSYWETKLK